MSTYTASEHLAPAVNEIAAELRAGRPVAAIAAECLVEYVKACEGEDVETAELTQRDFEEAVRFVAEKHGVALAD